MPPLLTLVLTSLLCQTAIIEDVGVEQNNGACRVGGKQSLKYIQYKQKKIWQKVEGESERGNLLSY